MLVLTIKFLFTLLNTFSVKILLQLAKSQVKDYTKFNRKNTESKSRSQDYGGENPKSDEETFFLTTTSIMNVCKESKPQAT